MYLRLLLCKFVLLHSLMSMAQPSVPTGVIVNGYDSHIELQWNANPEFDLAGYRIYRSTDSINFESIAYLGQNETSYIDFIGREDRSYYYGVSARNTNQEESAYSNIVSASTYEMSDEELMDMVQEYTFRYFWDFAHPVSGMARERNSTSIVTTGGSGFGVMAILVGIERGFITREEGVQRMQKIVDFLATASRFQGVFPHWMNGATGVAIPFSQYDDGGDLVETAFLMQGLLTARSFFSENDIDEEQLRNDITAIWEAVDWNFYRRGGQEDVLYWHWSPNYDWVMNFPLVGFNEAHIVYVLAAASPTHSIPASLYHTGWARSNYTNSGEFWGYPLGVGSYRGGPLFFSHYSYLGFDPRGIKDDYTNYFQRNIYHTLINKAYCVENPKDYVGYSSECWGLTASDDPWGYLAHEPTYNRDNGTISPTAALSSMPYTPESSMAALKYFYRILGSDLWGEYGFYDAFNLEEDWFASSYLAIDQGPIICMIENYRTGLLWDMFMQNDEIAPALEAMGFVEDDSEIITAVESLNATRIQPHIFPMPSSDYVILMADDIGTNLKSVHLVDLTGKYIPVEAEVLDSNQIKIKYKDLKGGSYFLQLIAENSFILETIIIQN